MTGPPSCQISPQARAARCTIAVRGMRSSWYPARALTASPSHRVNWRARQSASSMAWQAPCARYCTMGWAASPSRVILPVVQLVPVVHHPPPVPADHGGRGAHLVAAVGEGGVQLGRGAPVIGRLGDGRVAAAAEHGDLVVQLAAANRVLDQVLARSDP